MDGEIQLVVDDDGIAVIGEQSLVDAFLASEGLTALAVPTPRLSQVATGGSIAAKAASQMAESSGRWVKLTKESVEAIDKYGLRQSSTSKLATGVIKGKSGQIRGFVEFAKTPAGALTNPAMLAGVGGIMAQVAMQQAMDEITDYLARIDEKVDDILRAQKDAVLSQMIGVALVIDEAMVIREHRGRVDETTWSKVQGSSETIAHTQAYALRQLDALAEKLEKHDKMGDLAKVAKQVEATAQEWLVVLARCVQLQDALAVLELDRVMDAEPEEVDAHRLALRAARQRRVERISQTVEQLLGRMTAVGARANTKVLLHPTSAPGIVGATNNVVLALDDFNHVLGLESGTSTLEARRWTVAALEARDAAWASGADGVDAARRVSGDALSRAKTSSTELTSQVSRRVRRLRDKDER